MALSDRIRPNSEAAPWVIDEIKSLEAALKVIADYPLEAFGHDTKPDDRQLFGANGWNLTIGDVRRARTLLAQRGNWCRPCGGTVTEHMKEHCGFGRCPHKPKCICTLADMTPRADCPVHHPHRREI